MNMKQLITIFLLISFLQLFFHCTTTRAQSPAAAPLKAPAAPAPKAKAPAAPKAKAPAAPKAKAPTAANPPPTDVSGQPPTMVPVQTSKGPLNIVKILQKAGHFAFFIRLIKTTQEDIQFVSELNSTTDGLTIFAPTDGAFSNIIKAGTLNALTDQQKIQLVQFHVLPRFFSTPQFQTISNPLKTLAGAGQGFQVNITTSDNLVNVSSGLTKTSVSGIVYIDNQVAIYQVDKVMLPLGLFGPKTTTSAPEPAPPKDISGVQSPEVPKDVSGAVRSFVHGNVAILVMGTIVAAIFSL